jgi:hypothetical protein
MSQLQDWPSFEEEGEYVNHGLGDPNNENGSFSPTLFRSNNEEFNLNNDFLRSRSVEAPRNEPLREFEELPNVEEPREYKESRSREPEQEAREYKESRSREPEIQIGGRQNGPRRRIIRGKVDDLHHAVNDPTLRNRVEHALQYLSKYGLRNDVKTADGKEQKLDPDENLNRIVRPFRVKLGDHTRKFARKNYLNRHVIFPNEVDNENYYYRVDDSAKNQEHKGLLVEVIGSKWIGSSEKIAWLCKTVGSGQEFYTLYIDATSRIRKDNPHVQESLRAKKQLAKICFREDTVASLIQKLESAALQMREPSL